PATWALVAVGLPLLASLLLIILSLQLTRAWQGQPVTEELTKPPAELQPGIVGILLKGKSSPRSLAATLLHLATRGYLQVVHRTDGFSFGKRRSLDLPVRQAGLPASPAQGSGLDHFELVLLDKLFLKDAIRSTGHDIELRIGRHLFSRKVAEAYLAMYEAALAEGWFVRNPELTHRRWRFVSLVVMAVAILAFVMSLLIGPAPHYYTLGFAGLFFVGVVMERIAPLLPRRTRAGDVAFRQWQAFRNFLANPAPLTGPIDAQALYERYLPYAVACGCEVEWTERFLDLPFRVPDWYTSETELHVIEEFANSLFPIIGTVATDLARAREPYAV
ncbi:DUF2207 domain-containing protein, partial [Candidatus Berkelbacteria bacterium]|nr:DUF2207 domain-containing protein [Candidatus Berkelbacteria bacterium]